MLPVFAASGCGLHFVMEYVHINNEFMVRKRNRSNLLYSMEFFFLIWLMWFSIACEYVAVRGKYPVRRVRRSGPLTRSSTHLNNHFLCTFSAFAARWQTISIVYLPGTWHSQRPTLFWSYSLAKPRDINVHLIIKVQSFTMKYFAKGHNTEGVHVKRYQQTTISHT